LEFRKWSSHLNSGEIFNLTSQEKNSRATISTSKSAAKMSFCISSFDYLKSRLRRGQSVKKHSKRQESTLPKVIEAQEAVTISRNMPSPGNLLTPHRWVAPCLTSLPP
jgi:hypothetical protein